MYKLWYFLRGDESGEVHKAVFNTDEEYDKFIEEYVHDIEIIKEAYI